jgi:hypothetical protein
LIDRSFDGGNYASYSADHQNAAVFWPTARAFHCLFPTSDLAFKIGVLSSEGDAEVGGFLSVISALILAATVSAVQSERLTADSVPGEQEAKGALDIRIHPAGEELTPPAELSLANPQGAKTGRDPRTNQVFSEIPDSSYESESIADAETGTPGPEAKILHLRRPVAGEHTLWVIGMEDGAYDLEIRGYDWDLIPSDARFLNVKIGKNEEHRYLIRYTGERGVRIVAVRE